MKESLTFTVKRPLKDVFEKLTDIEKFAQLAPGGAVRIEKVPGKPSSGPGSAVVVKSGAPGVGDVVVEVLEWEEPRRCVRRFDVPDLPTTIALSLAEAPGGATAVTVDVEIEPKSMMYRMMLPVLAKKFQADKQKTLERLQQELDKRA